MTALAKKTRHLFLSRVKAVWKTDLPFFHPVDIDEIPNIPKGCNYRCNKYFAVRRVCYFVWFDFPQKRHGEFGVGISVSPSCDKSVLHHSQCAPAPKAIGTYSIAEFLGRQNFVWDLVDVDAQHNAAIVSLGGPETILPTHPPMNVWKPRSYDLSLDEIVSEAVRDVTEKLRKAVFPKLEITCD